MIAIISPHPKAYGKRQLKLCGLSLAIRNRQHYVTLCIDSFFIIRYVEKLPELTVRRFKLYHDKARFRCRPNKTIYRILPATGHAGKKGSMSISILWYDHITAAIGGAVAAMSGAAFLCYVTPAEHLALPNVDDVKQGIVASKIAAHAADIAKGIPHARDIDDKMGDARRVLDWDAQFACAIDPETAKAIRDARLPEDDHSDTCSMCGKFCAVRSMNKALAGEYIDIL